MRDRYRHLAEHRRPELADPECRRAVGQVHVCKPCPQLGLLVTEGRAPRPAECAEEVRLKHGLWRPFSNYRRAGKSEIDACVPYLGALERPVGSRLGSGCPFGALTLTETVEYSAIQEPRGVNEAAYRERHTFTELDLCAAPTCLSNRGLRAPECYKSDQDEHRDPRQSHPHDFLPQVNLRA